MVTPERKTYLSEMTAAGAAVAVFIAVYIVGFVHTGVLFTLLFGWVPAAVLAWMTARALGRAGRALAAQFPAGMGFDGFGSGGALRPATLSTPRRTRKHWHDDR